MNDSYSLLWCCSFRQWRTQGLTYIIIFVVGCHSPDQGRLVRRRGGASRCRTGTSERVGRRRHERERHGRDGGAEHSQNTGRKRLHGNVKGLTVRSKVLSVTERIFGDGTQSSRSMGGSWIDCEIVEMRYIDIDRWASSRFVQLIVRGRLC